MKLDKCDKNFTSDIDQFLNKFDQLHPEKSAAQTAEIAKYQKINRLRDQTSAEESAMQLWEEF